VLFAAITASRDERLLEGGVMRVLGANTRQLRLAQLSEFAALGLLAGVTAALGATALSGTIAVQVFDMPWTPDYRLMLSGAVAGVLLVSVFGLIATRRVASAPPADTLRALQGG
jgi:putative ABC transport system permease protein